MKSWIIVCLAVGLLVVGGLILNSNHRSKEEGNSPPLRAEEQLGSIEETKSTKTVREEASLQEEFTETVASFAEKSDPRYREGVHPTYFEIRATLKILRTQKMPEPVMGLSEVLYERLDADPNKGHPKRSAQVFVEVREGLEKLKEEHPHNYPQVLAIALLRAAYPEVRSTGAGNGAPEYAFQTHALNEASGLLNTEFYTGPNDEKRLAAIAEVGKSFLGVE